MASDFNQISNDGAGYVVTPQEVIRKDIGLLKALKQAPQDNAFIRHEERGLSDEIAQAAQDLSQQQHGPQSREDIISALAQNLIDNEQSQYSRGSSRGSQSYDDLLGNSGDDYGRTGDFNDPGMASLFDNYLPNGSGGHKHHHDDGMHGMMDSMLGGLNSNNSSNDGSDALGPIEMPSDAQLRGYDNGYSNGNGSNYNGITPGMLEQALDHSNSNQLDRNAFSNSLFNSVANSGFQGSNDNHHAPVSADSHIQFNSDSTLQGNANGHDLTGDKLLKANHSDLVDVSRNDLPGGFQLSNTVGDWTGGGSLYTQSINGTVNGNKVEVWTDDNGAIKAQVNGKVVDQNHPDATGTITYEAGGPGQCGTVSVNGHNDKTGASIKVDITKDITHDNNIGTDHRAGRWNHHGLTANISQTSGTSGRPLELGGAIGNEIGQTQGTINNNYNGGFLGS